ncbi:MULTISPECIES: helix-turn-helix domain-containing protein [unclassified Microbacterium]|uniref:helix-turn-helix domain-containing protein n=1 Tax=unclassified Microbacterium TaxID=2609290 RepID=UPI003442A029
MSVKVSSWVWHGQEAKGVTGNELVLLLALADVADDRGRCRYIDDEGDMTYAVLAVKVRVSRSTLIRMIAKLRERGLLDHTPGTKKHANAFQILVPWVDTSGFNLEPNRTDEVSDPTRFGVKPDEDSSLIRSDVLNDQFGQFWIAYPRKVAKPRALKAFLSAAKETDPAVIVAGAIRFSRDPNLPDKQFIPHPASWLNDGRWDDEELPPRIRPVGPGPAGPTSDDYEPGEEWAAWNR